MLRTVPIIAAILLVNGHASAQILRDDFRGTGGAGPAGWALREGAGRWDPATDGKRTISVTGTGEDVSYWARSVPGLMPSAIYAIRFRGKAAPGSSTHTLIAGLDVCNRDFGVADAWQDFGFVFHTPASLGEAVVRLGQWHLKGTVSFSDVALHAVTPLYRTVGGVALGAGEAILNRRYTFTAPLNQYGSNHARCLVRHTAPFNSNRWVFTGGSEVIYRHAVGSVVQSGASVTIDVNYRTGGQCVIEAAKADGPWIEIGRAARTGVFSYRLPASLFPATDVRVRLSGADALDPAGNSAPGAFQVDHYAYEAGLAGDQPDAAGSTTFVEEGRATKGLDVRLLDLGDFGRGGADAVRLRIVGDRATAGEMLVSVRLRGEGPSRAVETGETVCLRPDRPATVTVPYRWNRTGGVRCTVSVLRVSAGKTLPEPLYTAEAEEFVPAYFASDYGHSLTPVPSGELWWCEAPYKVSPLRLPPPQEHGVGLNDLRAVRGKGAIRMSAARREREHAQLVFRPMEDPGPVRVSVSDLVSTGPGARSRIPSAAVELREVAYVQVKTPTDRVGVVGEWPDPLPPIEGSWRPRVGRNNPLWITVTAPADARAGDYVGTITLAGGRWKREIALQLHVWDFALPATTSLRSGFGVQPGMIARYHNLRSPGSVERVWDRYMEAFRARRIAPYNPMALAPYKVTVVGRKWIGGIRDTAQAGSGKASLRVTDNSTQADVNATYSETVPIRLGGRYILSWKCRTARPGQQYLVTIGHFGANGQWMSGVNNDMAHTGTGEWDTVSVDITDRVPAGAQAINITLRASLWTERGDTTGTAWFDDVQLVAMPDDVPLLSGGDFEGEQELRVQLDFAEFDKAAARYLDGMGFNAFTVAIQGLPGGRHPNFDEGSFMGYAPSSSEYDLLMTQYGKQLEEHLAAKGWLSKAYVYWYDEPEEKDYPIVQEGSERLKRYFPRLKRMMTEQFETPLYGHVDLWCPISPAYLAEPAHRRQALGEEVWWYVCTGPKEPYCTLFIDHAAIELRTWLWQTWQRRIQGILIWETTWWTSPQQFTGDVVQNPWADPMAYVADVSGIWGNGDGRFFYPPNRDPNGDRQKEYLTGPVASLRWEMLGDGIEDWEYFRLLEGAVARATGAQTGGRGSRRTALLREAQALLAVPKSVTSDMTTFATDPQPMLRHRAALARAIESLTSRRDARPPSPTGAQGSSRATSADR